MDQNLTVELDGVVILSCDFTSLSLIGKPDGLSLIMKKEREGGQISLQEEPTNEDMTLGMKPLQSQESTETNTDHGAGYHFEKVPSLKTLNQKEEDEASKNW